MEQFVVMVFKSFFGISYFILLSVIMKNMGSQIYRTSRLRFIERTTKSKFAIL